MHPHSTTKPCSTCLRVLPLGSFCRHRRRADGHDTQCRECKHAAKARWMTTDAGMEHTRLITEQARARKREAVAIMESVKRTSGCVHCGEREPACLDFHHIDPSTKAKTVSRLGHGTHAWSDKGFVRLRAEMAKCVVLCANCHRKLHAGVIMVPALASA